VGLKKLAAPAVLCGNGKLDYLFWNDDGRLFDDAAILIVDYDLLDLKAQEHGDEYLTGGRGYSDASRSARLIVALATNSDDHLRRR